MTQVHCEIKTQINEKFDTLQVSIKKVEQEEIISENE